MIFSKNLLSGSTNGKGILVTGTDTTSSVIIHNSIDSTTSMDEVWIYSVNSSGSDVKLTIEWGETSTEGNIEFTVPAESGLKCIVPGLLLQNSLIVKAFAGTGSVLIVHGFVNRITI